MQLKLSFNPVSRNTTATSASHFLQKLILHFPVTADGGPAERGVVAGSSLTVVACGGAPCAAYAVIYKAVVSSGSQSHSAADLHYITPTTA